MKKIIEINEIDLKKLKVLSAFENLSVKALIERAISLFINQKENDRLENMTKEEKEDLGLLLLMQQVDKTDTVSEKEFLKALHE